MFTITVFLQELHHFSAIKTGLIFTAATGGVLVTSLAAERLAKRYQQRTLIRAGFLVTIGAIGLLLLALLKAIFSVWAFVPGLLVFGLGIGAMLTPSVNIVQSAFPEQKQGEISGLSRSVSNLGSSLGTAIAGTIVVAQLASSNKNLPYILAMVTLAAIALIGL
jgi:MFS family permease